MAWKGRNTRILKFSEHQEKVFLLTEVTKKEEREWGGGKTLVRDEKNSLTVAFGRRVITGSVCGSKLAETVLYSGMPLIWRDGLHM